MTTNDNSGALFRNAKKQSPSHPDYRGDVTVNGQKFWVNAWIKEGKRGKYLSLALRPAEESRRPANGARPAPASPPAKSKRGVSLLMRHANSPSGGEVL
jgi:hypothetical protein